MFAPVNQSLCRTELKGFPERELERNQDEHVANWTQHQPLPQH